MTANDTSILGRMGLFLFPWGKTAPSVETLTEHAERADAAGFHSVHLPYFFALDAGQWPWGNQTMIDALATLPFIAARTRRTNVCLSHWNFSMLHPYLWAQYLSSLDIATGGRAMTTLTLGKRKADFQVGMSSPEEAERRFDEGFGILRALLEGETLNGDAGGLWDVDGLKVDPVPGRKLPIWVNGSDEATIERVARSADYLKPAGRTPTEVREHFRPALERAAERHGRTAGIAMSMLAFVVDSGDDPAWLRDHVEPLIEQQRPGARPGEGVIYGEPDECAEQIVALMNAGVDYIALDLHFHGWETHAFGREQLDRVIERVGPLVSTADMPPPPNG